MTLLLQPLAFSRLILDGIFSFGRLGELIEVRGQLLSAFQRDGVVVARPHAAHTPVALDTEEATLLRASQELGFRFVDALL